MPRVRYFAQAREAAGTGAEVVPGATVAEVLAAAVARHGERLEAVLGSSAIWLDGEAADPADPVPDGSEVAVLPPVSGGLALWRRPESRPGGMGSLSPWPSPTP